MAREVTLVDAGLGNLASVERALTQVGAAVRVSGDPDVIAASRALVFPGQGAFSEHTDEIVKGAIGEAMQLVIRRGDPFLGVCLGMQLLFDRSDEAGGHIGLGILPGACHRFPHRMVVKEGELEFRLKIPHAGWNDVHPTGEHYYFVHSFYVSATQPSDVLWTATYGDIRFAAAVHRDNVYGCQFHPEKSQQSGLRFLRAFVLGSAK
jgi:glutamine amidotransferase